MFSCSLKDKMIKQFENQLRRSRKEPSKPTDNLTTKYIPTSAIQKIALGVATAYSWTLVLAAPVSALAANPAKSPTHRSHAINIKLPKPHPLPAFPYRQAAAERAKHPLVFYTALRSL